MSDTRAARLLALEKMLLQPSVRNDPCVVGQYLAPEFREIGQSGRTYDRDEILALLVDQPLVKVPAITNFEVQELAPSLLLVTYQCGTARRSSIWRQDSSQWQIVFHQGTPMPR